MAAPTQIEVVSDASEYSRYEEGRDVVVASVTIAGGTTYVAEPITVQMVKARNNRDIVVGEQTVEVTAATDVHSFTVSFDLRALVDSDNISLVRRGKYCLRATSVNSPLVTADSTDFKLSLLTSEKFTEDYLFGLRLTSTEVKQVKTQPVSITGVTVTDVSKSHPAGFASMEYSYRVDGPTVRRSLSWNGGPPTTLNGPGTYVLRAGTVGPFAGLVSSDYVEVRVGANLQLPTTSVTEQFIVEEKEISDKTLDSYIDKAISFVEKDLLNCHLEPTIVITDPDPTRYMYTSSTGGPVAIPVFRDYDEISTALTYFSPKKGAWISIYTPFMQILRVNHLYGIIAHVRVIDIDPSWIQPSMNGGMIQLIPFNQDLAFSYIGLIWNSSLYGPAELPNFWRYSIVSGLRECPPELIDFVAKKAAVDILTILGAAMRPGVGSTSLSRDGVSQSVSYVNTQKYGNFTGAITSMKESLKAAEPKLKARYKGVNMGVV